MGTVGSSNKCRGTQEASHPPLYQVIEQVDPSSGCGTGWSLWTGLSRGPWKMLTWADTRRYQSLVQVQVSTGDIPAHCWNSNTSLDTLKWALFPFSACVRKNKVWEGAPRHMQQPSHLSGLISCCCGLWFQTPDIWSNRRFVTSGRTRACRA